MIKKLFKFIFDIIRSSKKSDLGAYSAQSAFFMTISIIPFIMLLISIAKFLPGSEERLLSNVVEVFPGSARTLIASFMKETFQKSGAAVISITAVYTLWVASMGVFSVVKGLNRVFCTSETRNYFRVRIMSMFYTLAVLILLVLCLGLFVFGDTTIEILKNSVGGSDLLIKVFRTIGGTIILSMFFLVMYVVVPNRKTKIVTQLPGAIISALCWVGFSTLFSAYYESMNTFSFLYGSLAVMVFFMLWLFICIYILFIGAAINKNIEDRTEYSYLMEK